MFDGDGERALLGWARVNDHAVADRMHRRAIGVVELDALMRLEVAAHRRAEAVGLIDVRLICESYWAAEPGVAESRGLAGERYGPVHFGPRGIPNPFPRPRRVRRPRAATVK